MEKTKITSFDFVKYLINLKQNCNDERIKYNIYNIQYLMFICYAVYYCKTGSYLFEDDYPVITENGYIFHKTFHSFNESIFTAHQTYDLSYVGEKENGYLILENHFKLIFDIIIVDFTPETFGFDMLLEIWQTPGSEKILSRVNNEYLSKNEFYKITYLLNSLDNK